MAAAAASQSGSGAKGALKRHIGPLPTWGWVAIVGGGIVVYYFWQQRTASSAASSSQTGTGTATQPPEVFQIYPSAVETPAPAAGGTPAPGSSSPTPPVQPGAPNKPAPETDLYYHAHPAHGAPYVSRYGRRTPLQSGKYTVGGKSYYYHSHPKHGKPYWSLNGKRVSPPSGAVAG